MGERAISAGMLREDKVGLAVAIVLHILLAVILAMQFAFSTPRPLNPERMTVSLTTEVSLESTAPDPVSESRAAIAPTLSDEPAPETAPAPADIRPRAVTPPPPPPTQTRTTPRIQPRIQPRTQPRTPAPARERSRPDRETTPPARTPPAQTRPAPAPARNSGGSRIGENFLGGQGASTQTDETRVPASQIGRSARASLQQAINRQIKPHWDAPSGLDAEQLVTIVAFKLNEDGSLAGRPTVVNQTGINDANRRQASTHADNAVRAVQRAAPFDLPDEYYEAWKNITAWRFDRRL